MRTESTAADNAGMPFKRLFLGAFLVLLSILIGMVVWQSRQSQAEDLFCKTLRDRGCMYERAERFPAWLRTAVLRLCRFDLRRFDPIVLVILDRNVEAANIDLSGLGRMGSLRLLIVEADLTTAEWKVVGDLNQLEELRVLNSHGCLLTADFEQISRLRNLRRLVLKPAHLDTEGFRHLRKLPRLEALRIPRMYAYRDQPHPQHPQTVSNPKMKRVKPDAEALRDIARLRSLRRLDFADCREIGDEELLVLTSLLPDGSDPLPNLTELALQNTSMNFFDGTTFANLRNLNYLSVSETRVDLSRMMQRLQRQGLKAESVGSGNHSIIVLER